MDLTAWIIFLSAITFTLSQRMGLCTKNPDCVPTQPSNINFFGPNPKGDTKYSPPGPISLRCEATGDVDTIRWIRNNSDGESKILNSTSFGDSIFFRGLKVGRLEDFLKDDKFPYIYQCIAFGKCCDEHRSPSITVVESKPEIVIHEIKSEMLLPTVYYGFGKVRISCRGEGDNLTRVHWNRTDENGNIITLNTTSLDHNNGGVWKAELVYRPNPSNVSYTYKCVVKNKCCPTEISQPLTISYNPTFDCQLNPFGVSKPIEELIAVPNKRSVKISWMYDPDPEDTGLVVGVTGTSLEKTFNLTTREYVFHGLVPNTQYSSSYQVLYIIHQGKSCTTFKSVHGPPFFTLPDVPSRPRNVSVIAKENTLNVSWEAPKDKNGDGLHFIIFWRRVGSSEEYKQRNVTESPYSIKDLTGYSTYHIKLQAANIAGIGNSSEPISASTQEGPGPYIRIATIISEIKTHNYTGFGKINVTCTGEGDNATKVHWTRTDREGNNITLSTTNLRVVVVVGSPGKWKADLLDRPDTTKFPYTYKCIVENKCCLTKMSSPLTMTYSPPPDGECPSFGVIKPIQVDPVPNKRSVRFNWQYDPDSEDTGFSFSVSGASPAKNLNVAAREYIVRGLEPNKKYNYSYSILHGKGCKTSMTRQFTTLPDYPSRPRNVTVITLKGVTLNVSWLPPKYLNGEFKHYILSLRNNDENVNESINSTTTTSFVFTDLEELTTYSIKVFAVNNVGIGNSSIPVSVQTKLLPEPSPSPSSDDSSDTGAIAGGLTGAILFLILVVIIFYLVRRRIRIKEHEKSVREFHTLRRFDNSTILASEIPPQEDAEALPEKADVPDELSYIVLLEDWEIAPDNLKLLDKKLGGGQFGIVKQGLLTTAKGDPEVVAVKMLKDSAKESDLQDLMTELTILKEVNKVPHPNVIRLIGGCSIGGKLHVITELCPGGSLRHLLINSRIYPSEENSSNYINLSSTLNHRQLLKIAADISNGMIHLSSQKFVHRDLAARNILIGDDNMAKVSDFGLARDVRGAEEYIRNNQNLLPVKWMALESLLHGRFTTASDVWSYGVLLQEITTLGEEPYKNISPYNIVSHVGSGCRMSQSPQCSDELYDIMTKCWKVEPTERPTFEDIREFLQNMLMDNEKSYINIAQIIDEGALTTTTESKNAWTKDGSVRYTKA